MSVPTDTVQAWLTLAERGVESATARGADGAEIFGVRTRTVSLRWRHGEPEWQRSAIAGGLGLRVFRNRCLGYAYTTDVSEAGVESLVDGALSASGITSPSVHPVLPVAADYPPVPALDGLLREDMVDLSVTRRQALQEELHAAVTAHASGRVKPQRAHYGDLLHDKLVVNSRGIRHSYTTSTAFAWLEVVGNSDGERQTGHAFASGRDIGALDVDDLAARAVEQARVMSGPEDNPSGRTTLLLSPTAAADLVGNLAPSFSGQSVAKGHSFLADALGTRVGSGALTLVDDPLMTAGLSARPMDDEGVPSQRTTIVDAGELRSFLHNTETAARSGARSTANAHRSSYRSTPEVAPSNLVCLPGEGDEAALLARAGRCLYVFDWLGTHASTANTHTGRFSIGISGCWRSPDGWQAPVRRATVAGSYTDLLGRIVAAASDIRFVPSNYTLGAPALLIEDVPVGGDDD
jgi:PmbA protein